MGGSCSLPSIYKYSADKVSVNDFAMYQVIGHGKFGKVYLGVHHETKKLLAVKQIDLLRTDAMIRNELNALRTIGRHPYITELGFSAVEQDMCYVALSLASGGCLREHMMSQQFCESSVAFIVVCIDSALSYIHARGILHRDIKPANIVLDRLGYPCLIDFGISYIRSHDDAEAESPLTCHMSSGTEAYCAPELLTTSHEHGIASDYWSLGIMAFEMIFGHRPFRRRVPKAFVRYIQKRMTPDQSSISPRTLDTYGSSTSMSISYSSENSSTNAPHGRMLTINRRHGQSNCVTACESRTVVHLRGGEGEGADRPFSVSRASLRMDRDRQGITAVVNSQVQCREGQPQQQDENEMCLVNCFGDEGNNEEDLQLCAIHIPSVTNRNVPVSPDLESFLRAVLDVRVQCRLGGSDQPVRGHPWVDVMGMPGSEAVERRAAPPPALLAQAAFTFSQTNKLTPIESCKQQLRPVAGRTADRNMMRLTCNCSASTGALPFPTQTHHIQDIGDYNYMSRKMKDMKEEPITRTNTELRL